MFELQYIVRQFLIFGTHVHVGVEGADRAIYVADGIRRYLPLMLALSTNSPFLARPSHGDDVVANARVPRPAAGRNPTAFRLVGGLLRAGSR